jgi:hypothetical protein
MNMTDSRLTDAVARLDQDIADTERRLAELREMREGLKPFLDQYVSLEAIASEEAFGNATVTVTPPRISLTDSVVNVFKNRPTEVLDVDEVLQALKDSGVKASSGGVRNALYYAARTGKLHKEHRGRFALKDTSAPAVTGADVGEEPNSEGSSGEIGGGRDDSSTPPHDQDDGAGIAPDHLGRVGD